MLYGDLCSEEDNCVLFGVLKVLNPNHPVFFAQEITNNRIFLKDYCVFISFWLPKWSCFASFTVVDQNDEKVGHTFTAYSVHINGVYHCQLRYRQIHALHDQLRNRVYHSLLHILFSSFT